MMLLPEKETKGFQDLFSKTTLVGDGEIASQQISPSKLYCQVYEAFKLQGVPMMGQEESFESRGYAEAGNSRHRAIQKFLKESKEVVWVNPYEWVEKNNLPFQVRYDEEVRGLSEKYGIPFEEARDLLGDYEVTLIHRNGYLAFKLDGLIEYQGRPYIVEIKTIGKKDFEKIPLEKHQWQGKAYSYLLKIDRIAWIYECRENFKIKTAFQVVSEKEAAQVKDRLNSIIKYKDDPTKLERNLNRCQYCRYKPKCLEVFLGKKEDEGEVF